MSDKSLPSKVASLRAGASALLPIYPESFEDVVRLARLAIIAGMIKPQKIGWGENQETEPPEATEARATMIVLQGMELGLPPMMAIQLLAMINGRIVAHSEAVPGILLSRGFKIKQEYVGGDPGQDTFAARATLTRPDGQVFVAEFSVADAKIAGLWSPQEKITKKGKNGAYQVDNDSAWHKYWKRMLWARALGFVSKDGGADALKGIMVREEMDDFIRSQQAIDVTPVRAPMPSPPSLADIPDPDAEDVASPATEAPASEDMAKDDAGFAERLLVDLSQKLEGVKGDASRMEVWESMAELVSSLSDADQRRAEAIFEGRPDRVKE